jgi:formylglycine-generating enzyme required for sulfatase activity
MSGSGCADWYDPNAYTNTAERNPKPPEKGEFRVVRGGSWFDHYENARCSVRDREQLGIRDFHVGVQFPRSL